MIGGKTPSISKNLTISLIILVGLLAMLFTGLPYYQISKNTEWQLEKTADKYIDSMTGTLQVPLWDMDRENINTVCSYLGPWKNNRRVNYNRRVKSALDSIAIKSLLGTYK